MRDADTVLRVSAAADQASLRRAHLGLVLRSLRDGGPRSRSRLAADLGLTRTAASSLVAELEDLGLVREGAREQGRVGRPGTSVELAGAGAWGIGGEINVDHVAAMAVNPSGEVVSELRQGLDSRRLEPREVVAQLAGLLDATIEEAQRHGAVAVGVTVGVAGLVDVTRDVVTLAPNLGWRDLPVATMVADELRALRSPRATATDLPPVHLDNEANLAAIAETGPGREDLLVLFGEVGVGGGVVAEGRLLRGRHGWAGEVGHIVVDPQGRPCGCGRIGCWETRIGLGALLELATAPDDPVRDPSWSLEDRLATLTDRARRHDARTLAALDEVGGWLGTGAATLVNVLNPGLIVLSGYFAGLGEWLLPAVRTQLETGVLAPRAGDTRVVLSTLGSTAAVRGAALVSLEPLFADPTAVRPPAALNGGIR